VRICHIFFYHSPGFLFCSIDLCICFCVSTMVGGGGCLSVSLFFTMPEVQYCNTSNMALLLRNAFAIWNHLCLHMNFRIDFSISMKNDVGILKGILM
jgi:hypothetical protein